MGARNWFLFIVKVDKWRNAQRLCFGYSARPIHHPEHFGARRWASQEFFSMFTNSYSKLSTPADYFVFWREKQSRFVFAQNNTLSTPNALSPKNACLCVRIVLVFLYSLFHLGPNNMRSFFNWPIQQCEILTLKIRQWIAQLSNVVFANKRSLRQWNRDPLFEWFVVFVWLLRDHTLVFLVGQAFPLLSKTRFSFLNFCWWRN